MNKFTHYYILNSFGSSTGEEEFTSNTRTSVCLHFEEVWTLVIEKFHQCTFSFESFLVYFIDCFYRAILRAGMLWRRNLVEDVHFWSVWTWVKKFLHLCHPPKIYGDGALSRSQQDCNLFADPAPFTRSCSRLCIYKIRKSSMIPMPLVNLCGDCRFSASCLRIDLILITWTTRANLSSFWSEQNYSTKFLLVVFSEVYSGLVALPFNKSNCDLSSRTLVNLV